jgi:hypothetical protein
VPRPTAVITLALVSVLVAWRAAPAHAGEIVGILHVEVDGVSEAAAEAFETAIEEVVAGQGLAVAPRERLGQLLLDSSYVEGCLFGPCLEAVYRVTEVRLVLVARILAVGSSYSLVVSLMDTRTGRPASQVAEECAVCTLEEAVSSVTLAVIALLTGTDTAQVRDPGADPTRPPDLEAMQRRLGGLENQVAGGGRSLRRAALFFGGAAVITGAAAAYLLHTDRDPPGYAVTGAAGAFAVTSATMLVLSRRF